MMGGSPFGSPGIQLANSSQLVIKDCVVYNLHKKSGQKHKDSL